MNINDLKNGVPGLVMQGLLMDVKEAMQDSFDKKTSAPVLNVSLLQTETQMKNGVEMSNLSTKQLVVKDENTFGEYFALLGSFVSIPVGNMVTKQGGLIFFIPKGAHPKLLKLESQPLPTRAESPIKSPLDKAA